MDSNRIPIELCYKLAIYNQCFKNVLLKLKFFVNYKFMVGNVGCVRFQSTVDPFFRLVLVWSVAINSRS